MKQLVLATRNRKKREELAALLADLDCEVLTLDDFSACPEVEETGRTFEENAVRKATAVADATSLVTLADDSGLVVDALGGEPGVHSARYASDVAGENAGDGENIVKLLRELADVPAARRTARFVCAVAIAAPGRLLATMEGCVEGRILEVPRGAGGFGYDPVFYYEPFGATFAEVDQSKKSSVSHRGQALKKARAWLAKNWAGE